MYDSRQLESRQETLANMAKMVITSALVAFYAWSIQGQCNNGWLLSIAKSLAIMCGSMVAIVAVAAPLGYWDMTEKRRARAVGTPFNGTLAGSISDSLNPETHTGWLIFVLVTYLAFWYFTKGCEI
jgi:hypothetical protein